MPAPPSVDAVAIEGHELVRLREPASGAIAHVAPSRGCNVVRFAADAGAGPVEAIAGPPGLAALERLPTRWGAGVLFPYPGRVSGDAFSFRGSRVALPPDPQTGNAMHGVVRRRAWRVIGTGADRAAGAWMTARVASREDGIPAREWPFPFALTLTVRLRGGRLRTEARVENAGDAPMPFGLGFHPYLRAPLGPAGGGGQCEVAIDAAERWGSTSAPPAAVAPVAPGEWPRRALPLSGIPMTRETAEGPVRNHKFMLRAPAGGDGSGGGVRARLTDRANGLEAVVAASEGMRALVFYTPPDFPAVSLEPHTCIPNAFNLGGGGAPDPGLIALGPGEAWEGWYELRLEALA